MDTTDLFPDGDVPPAALELFGGAEPELEGVIAAFNDNNQRWRSHRWLAQLAASCGVRYRTAHVKVLWDTLGKPFWVAGDDTLTLEDLRDAIREKIEQPDFETWPQHTGLTPYFWDLIFHPYHDVFKKRIESCFSGICSSEIVDAWTMFETLSADLWVSAVNAIPDPLAHCLGDGARIKTTMSDSDQSNTPKKLASEKFSIEELSKLCGGTFDLSVSMGDVMRDTECVRFIKLRGIREAYSSAFVAKHPKTGAIYPDTTDIDNALAATALDELAIVRNLIVHSAGNADRKYRDVDRPRFASLPELKVGEKFPLDAHSVKRLIEPVVESSVKLMNGVDKWMKIYRGRTPPS